MESRNITLKFDKKAKALVVTIPVLPQKQWRKSSSGKTLIVSPPTSKDAMSFNLNGFYGRVSVTAYVWPQKG